MAKYSTCLHVMHFLTPLLLLFFSIIMFCPLTFVYAHSFTLHFPLLFFVVFQSHFLHSCYCMWTLELWKCSQLPIIDENNFWQLFYFFTSLSFPPIIFIFLFAHCLLINTWSFKLIQAITTTLCVPCITTCKHFTSSLRMNFSYFIF